MIDRAVLASLGFTEGQRDNRGLEWWAYDGDFIIYYGTPPEWSGAINGETTDMIGLVAYILREHHKIVDDQAWQATEDD